MSILGMYAWPGYHKQYKRIRPCIDKHTTKNSSRKLDQLSEWVCHLVLHKQYYDQTVIAFGPVLSAIFSVVYWTKATYGGGGLF